MPSGSWRRRRSGRRRRRRGEPRESLLSVGSIADRCWDRRSAPAKAPIEINPARNGGKDYHFQEVVRNKEARKHMHAHTCEGCAGVSLSFPFRPILS